MSNARPRAVIAANAARAAGAALFLGAQLLSLGCNSGSSPTDPVPPIGPPNPNRYTGTIEIVAVEGGGSALSVLQSCGLSRTRAFVGREFEITVSFGDIPLLVPPGGRWGAELFGVPPFGCRMSYFRSGGSTQVTDLLASCTGEVASLSDAQIQTCNGSRGVEIEPRLMILPSFADGAATIAGPGRIDATMTFELDPGGGNIDQGALLYDVVFDLRRGS